MTQDVTEKKAVSLEQLEQACVLVRRILLTIWLVAPLVLVCCLMVPNYPSLLPGLGNGEALAVIALFGALIYAKRCAGRIGRLLDEPYVGVMMSPYIVGTVALRMGYRGGVFSKLRKVEPRG